GYGIIDSCNKTLCLSFKLCINPLSDLPEWIDEFWDIQCPVHRPYKEEIGIMLYVPASIEMILGRFPQKTGIGYLFRTVGSLSVNILFMDDSPHRQCFKGLEPNAMQVFKISFRQAIDFRVVHLIT